MMLQINQKTVKNLQYARVRYEMIANEARGAELATIISYLASVSGIIILLKTVKKYC